MMMKLKSWKIAALSLLPFLFFYIQTTLFVDHHSHEDLALGIFFIMVILIGLLVSIAVPFLYLPKTRVFGAILCAIYSVGLVLLTKPQIGDLINPEWIFLIGWPITCLSAACIIALWKKV